MDDWFGVVRWCDDDLRDRLIEFGYEGTDEQVSLIRRQCEHHSFTDGMIETGWNYIDAYIQEQEKNLGIRTE